MKRRNREQRARMRAIQEFRLNKSYQRAMDTICQRTGLSYRTFYLTYKDHLVMLFFSLTVERIRLLNVKKLQAVQIKYRYE